MNQRFVLKINKKYSKSSKFYKDIKSDFFSLNDKNLKTVLNINKKYTSQVRRISCKLCEKQLKNIIDFEKHKVKYVFCRYCDHLNGLNIDTSKFANDLYTSNGGEKYSKFYLDNKYESRIKNIYMPKAKFLKKNLPKKKYNIYDYGCGLGHFVDSCLRLGLKITGGDVSKSLISNGNKILNTRHNCSDKLELIKNNDSKIISYKKADILCLLGVIEHISDLKKFFKDIRKSNYKYIYYAVPTYGFSVIVESVFEKIFPRQLSAGHTHLFTEKSLIKLNQILGITTVAEWRFGTDIMDLKRSIQVTLSKKKYSKYFQEKFDHEFSTYGDKIQSVIDKAHNCSQIHVLGKRLK